MLVASNPDGTTFCLNAGTYEMSTAILARSNDRIIGVGRETILDFSRVTNGYGLYGYGTSAGQHDVTVRDLVIQGCHVTAHTCAGLQQGMNWTAANLEIRDNDVGLTGNCSGCFVHDNAVYGIISAGLIEDSEIARNGGTPDSGGSTGASKTVHQANMTWRGNHVHDNLGPAIWCDGCWQGSVILIENNLLENNVESAIDMELVWGSCPTCGTGSATIHNNTFVGNDSVHRGRSCYWGAQVYVNNSQGIVVTGNYFDSSGGTNALCVVDTVRPGEQPEYVVPFTATGNTFVLAGPALVGGTGYQGGYVLDATTFVVQDNEYHVDSPTTAHWSWYLRSTPATFAQWQAYGMDGASVIDTD